MVSSSAFRWLRLTISQLNNARRRVRRSHRSSSIAAASQSLEQRDLLTVTTELLQDTNQIPEYSLTRGETFFSIGDVTYFSASNYRSGKELWRTDRTTAGTRMVEDVWRGGGSSNPVPLANLNGRLLFQATDPVHGTELWTTDGISAGTKLLKDQSPGAEGVAFQSGAMLHDSFLFYGYDSSLRKQSFYQTDGTASGTGVWLDRTSAPEILNGDVVVIGATNQYVFFTVDRQGMPELYRTDGTLVGTKSMGNFKSITSSVVHGDQLAFVVSDFSVGQSLWKSDGTLAGTKEIRLLRRQTFQGASMKSVGETLFIADRANQGLWTSDLTEQGTVLRKESWNSDLLVTGSLLFYFKLENNGEYTLHKTDFAFSSEAEISVPSDFRLSYLDYSTHTDFSHFFRLSSQVKQLWVLDAQGLRAIEQFDNAQILAVQAAGTTTVIFYIDQYGYDPKLAVATGPSSEISFLGKIESNNGSAQPATSVTNGKGLLFSSSESDDGVNTRSPLAWYSDGTKDGTWRVQLDPNVELGTQPLNATQMGGAVFFTAEVFGFGQQLLRLDQASRKAIVLPRIVSAGRFELTPLDKAAYFVMPASPRVLEDQYPNAHLVRVDEQGTTTLALGQEVGFPGAVLEVAALNGVLYLLCLDEKNGLALWRSDGSLQGTQLVRSLSSEPVDLESMRLIAGTNRLFLTFKKAAQPSATLWTSDGTATGTHPVDGPLGDGSLYLYLPSSFNVAPRIIVAGDRCFLIAYSNTQKEALWATDGTREGSFPIASIGFTGTMLKMGDAVVFGSDRSNRLSRSDGTRNGTQYLLDVPVDGWLFFAYDQAFYRRQLDGQTRLWRSDGTVSGTVPLSDANVQLVAPFAANTGPSPVAESINGGVVFIGDGGQIGTEPYALTNTEPPEVPKPPTIHRTVEGNLYGLSWNHVWGAVDYEVRLSSASTGEVVKQFVADQRRIQPIDPALPAGAYVVELRAIGADGSKTAWSERRSFVTGNVPVLYGLPRETTTTSLVVGIVSPDNSVSTTVWVVDVRTNRQVALIELPNTTADRLSLSTTLPVLPPSQYAIQVWSKLADGRTSPGSPSQQVTILLPAPNLRPAVAVEASGRVKADWSNVPGSTSYEVEVISQTSSAPVRSFHQNDPTSLSLSIALPGDQYSIRVRAWQGAYPLSAWSTAESVLLRSAPKVMFGANAISWKSVSAVTGYHLTIRNSATGKVLTDRFLSPAVTDYRDIPFGRYSVSVVSLYESRSAVEPAGRSMIEVFAPSITPLIPFASTADATPTISWKPASEAVNYEIQILSTSGKARYIQTGLVSTSHRVAVPLPAGQYKVWLRANSANGARSLWGEGRSLIVGAAVTVTHSGGKISWTSANEATNFELWIDYKGLGQSKSSRIIHEQTLVGNRFVLPDSLAKGRYTIWVRAYRAEASQRYFGLWSNPLNIDV